MIKRWIKKAVNFVFSFQFSKFIILFESYLVWRFANWAFRIAEMCIGEGFSGSLPWIATAISAIFAAYGVSVSFYYNKSKAEEVKKIDAGLGQTGVRRDC